VGWTYEPGHDTDHSPHLLSRLRMSGSTPTCPTCLHPVHRGNIAFPMSHFLNCLRNPVIIYALYMYVPVSFPWFSILSWSFLNTVLESWRSWVHALWYNYERNQHDATIQVNWLFLVSSTCFGQCFRPSSGVLDCIYSIW